MSEGAPYSPDEAFKLAVDHADRYEDPARREAFVTGAMAVHMALVDGRLPSRLGLDHAEPPDRS